jgi:hypothetical protein
MMANATKESAGAANRALATTAIQNARGGSDAAVASSREDADADSAAVSALDAIWLHAADPYASAAPATATRCVTKAAANHRSR